MLQPASPSDAGQVKASGKSRNSTDTLGDARATRSRLSRRLQIKKAFVAQEVVFKPIGLRDLEGELSLSASQRKQTE